MTEKSVGTFPFSSWIKTKMQFFLAPVKIHANIYQFSGRNTCRAETDWHQCFIQYLSMPCITISHECVVCRSVPLGLSVFQPGLQQGNLRGDMGLFILPLLPQTDPALASREVSDGGWGWSSRIHLLSVEWAQTVIKENLTTCNYLMLSYWTS